jgi:hypothetical protein
VATRSKATVCGRLLAGIVCSNPIGGMNVCLLWVLCVIRQRSLRRVYHSFRAVLLSVGCPMCVIAEPRKVRTRNVVEAPQKNKKNDLRATSSSLIQIFSSERPSLLNTPGYSTSIDVSYFHYFSFACRDLMARPFFSSPVIKTLICTDAYLRNKKVQSVNYYSTKFIHFILCSLFLSNYVKMCKRLFLESDRRYESK